MPGATNEPRRSLRRGSSAWVPVFTITDRWEAHTVLRKMFCPGMCIGTFLVLAAQIALVVRTNDPFLILISCLNEALTFLFFTFCILWERSFQKQRCFLVYIGMYVILFLLLCIQVIYKANFENDMNNEEFHEHQIVMMICSFKLILQPIVLVLIMFIVGVEIIWLLPVTALFILGCTTTFGFWAIDMLYNRYDAMIVVIALEVALLLFSFFVVRCQEVVRVKAVKETKHHLDERYHLSIQKAQLFEQKKKLFEQKEQLHQLKDQVIGYIFHEVRNPINNITLAAELATAVAAKFPNGQSLLDLTENILQSAAAASHVLNDALCLQKLQNGKFEFFHKPFLYVDACTQVVRMMQPQMSSKGIECTLVADPSLNDVVVVGDANRLKQVITNFLSNAYKFTPHGGTVRVEITRVYRQSRELQPPHLGQVTTSFTSSKTTTGTTLEEFGTLQPPPLQAQQQICIRTAVIDSGVGISDEDRPRIFLPWSQVRAGEQQAGQGSGLGLSLSKDFVETGHHGKIDFTSSSQGTCFFFEIDFPLSNAVMTTPLIMDRKSRLSIRRQSQQSTVLLVENDPIPENEIDVLVVDDSALTRKLMAKTLEGLGVTFDTCEDGLQAVKMLTGEKAVMCAVVLMDKEMPVMDGFAATRELRRLKFPGRIVGITGNALDEQVCAVSGVNEFVRYILIFNF
eukprot:c9918_g1_i1.p1 GENE.c9918_g1_i1~~c9918_g1_i1.p1  ORF type:complete len:696 (-),score=111.86 c9918_g1_i1:22-2073(-)